MKKNSVISLIYSLLALASLLLLWAVAYFAVGNEYLMPSFWDTAAEAARLLSEAFFWRAFGLTLLRTLISFLVSAALGILLAVLASLSRGLRAFLAPVVSVLRTVPTMAVILLIVLWTNRTVAPAIVTLLVLLPAVYAAALAAIDEVGKEYGDLAAAFRVPRSRKIFKMYLPLVAPELLAQGGPLLSMGLKITVSGEVLSLTMRSLGYLMQQAQVNYPNIPRLFALTIVVILLGFLLEGLGALARKCIVRWRR